MSHIFISYSHKDTEYAHKLADVLQDKGFAVWIDERLDYGSQWPHEIQKQLDSCYAFIVIMSPRSFESEWVQSELQRAKRKMKPVLPLLLDGDEPWLSVESTQYYDVRGKKLPDARFFSVLTKLVPVSETVGEPAGRSGVTSEVPYTRPGAKQRNRLAFALIGGAVAILAACGTVIGGAALWNWINNPPAVLEATSSINTPVEQGTEIPSEIVPITGKTPTAKPTQTKRPTPTSSRTPTSTSLPPSGTCKDGYVPRLIRPNDKVCVPPSSKSQAQADNVEADSRTILYSLINAYGPNACAYGYVHRNALDGDVVCVEPWVRDQVQTDNAVAQGRWIDGAYGPYTCVSGYVWRAAVENDLVCVTPDQRDQAVSDNSQAESRKAINVYSEDECLSGYVWREAFSGDHVCVTPDVRAQTAFDNAEAPKHTWP
jgi:hypothetical protein